MRPPALAGDDVPMLPVLQHAVETLEADGFDADIVVLVAADVAASPRRTHRCGRDWLERAGGDSVVSVVEVPHQFNPASRHCASKRAC